MFSIFDYLRRLIRDSVLAGVQDAFEILDQAESRDSIASAAHHLLDRASPTGPGQEAPATERPAPRPAQLPPSQVPSAAPTDLIPASLSLPSPEIPRLEGYQNFDRRKKGSGRPPKHQQGRQ